MMSEFARWSLRAGLVAFGMTFAAIGSAAAQDTQDLAKDLANPIASLISVPIQANYNSGIGPEEEGKQFLTNIQPVIPIELSDDWNVISRTIVPVISQDDIFPGAGSQFGLGDIVQSFFFSPKKVVNGFTWGAGPVVLLPTATDDLLGSGKWGAGPTAVALWQGSGWTVGGLANHIWSFAGDDDKADISLTYLQPFVAYTTPSAWTFTVNLESTYNWNSSEWSIPINLLASKLVTIGKQPVSLTGGVRYWAASPEGVGPTGWGGRFAVTLLFPKG